jgi:putative transposase
MKYNPVIHKRRSIRLKGYDYSQAGFYFITICTQFRECLFGEIHDGKMQLNDASEMIVKWYNELMNKFPDIECGEMIIMPNHFHCIIENTRTAALVGADLCVCPNNAVQSVGADLCVCPNNAVQSVGADLCACPNNAVCVCPNNAVQSDTDTDKGQTHRSAPTITDKPILGEHIGSPLHSVVQWFKTMTTNEYIRGVKNLGWKRFDGKLWQRNYYEHIIRNEQSYQNIANYIINNPARWQYDKFYQ